MTSRSIRISLLALAATVACAPAQAQSRFFWSQTLDGPAGRDDEARDLAVSPDGQVFVAGSSADAAGSDALVLSYDPYGRLLWQRRLDLGGEESAGALALDPAAGAVFVLGSSVATGAAAQWTITKLEAVTGTVLWQSTYSGPQAQGGVPYAMALDTTGGILAGGWVGLSFAQQSCIARFDASGALTWERILPSPGATTNFVAKIAVDPTGDLFLRAAAFTGPKHWTIHRLTTGGSVVWSQPIGLSHSDTQGPELDSTSSFVYALNPSNNGTPLIVKRDAAGSLLWTLAAESLFGNHTSTKSLEIAPGDDVVALGSNGVLVRLDPSGRPRWTSAYPRTAWFDVGLVTAGLALDAQGGTAVRARCRVWGTLSDFDSVARWDAAGNFLWSQGVRSYEPDTYVHTDGLAIAPQGSILIGGFSRAPGADKDVFVAAVRKSSELACFGDGSSGPCPCGNSVLPGTPSGCGNGSGALGARLDDQGIASLGGDSLRFFATGLPSSGIALLLQGQPAALAIPFQDGLSCIGGRKTRIYAAALAGPHLDLAPAGGPRVSARSAALGDVIQPGTSRAYQLFYRGPTSTCQPGNGNLSNAVVVDWAQ